VSDRLGARVQQTISISMYQFGGQIVDASNLPGFLLSGVVGRVGRRFSRSAHLHAWKWRVVVVSDGLGAHVCRRQTPSWSIGLEPRSKTTQISRASQCRGLSDVLGAAGWPGLEHFRETPVGRCNVCDRQLGRPLVQPSRTCEVVLLLRSNSI
jgi:hypothetical protein